MKRRKPGQGSMFLSKDGHTWRGFVTVGYTADGKQIKKWRQAQTQRELTAKLNKLLHLSSARILNDPQSYTVEQWLERFLEYKRAEVRPKTQEAHRYYVDKIVPHLGRKRLVALTRSHVRAFYAALADAGLSLSVRRHVHHFFKAALNEAFQERLIDRNPAVVDVPRGRPAKPGRAWDVAQVHHFLDTAQDDRLYPLFHTLLYQGVRIGEALALTWDDIDGDALQVTKTLGVVRNKPHLGPAKNDRGQRTFFLLPQTLEVLEHIQKPLGSSLVFPSEVGTHLDSHNVRRTYRRLVTRSELPYITLHGHRHTFITLAQHAGVPAYVVAAIAGQDPSVTARIYTHVSDEQKREAVRKLAEYLTPTPRLKDAA